MTAPTNRPRKPAPVKTRTGRQLTPVPPSGDLGASTFLVESPGEPARVAFNVSPPTADASPETWLPLLSGSMLDPKKAEIFYVLSHVETRTIPTQYVNAIICDSDGSPIPARDGTAQRFIIRLGYTNRDGKVTRPVVVWEGSIDVRATYLAYEVTSGRTLRPLEWSRYVQIRTVNRAGFVRTADVPVMDFRQQQSRASYIDRLGIDISACIGDLVKYIRIKLHELGESGLAVHGQGPVLLDDGSRVFCAQSTVFNDRGEIRPDIRVDVTAIPEQYRYYDVTPRTELDPEKVAAGCRDLIAAYGEIPSMPEIPAAFLGSLFTAPIVAVEPRFFIALFLSGEHGSGKSVLSLRYDAVQSRTLRGRIEDIKPALNLGDRTGTTKGSKYRSEGFGGFAITADDVIKRGDSQHQINEQRDYVSNLTRSFESGGAPLGKLDKAKNRVVSGEAGTLQGNVKYTSEERIPGASTLERLIVLPHLTTHWAGGLFDTEVSERLATPESIECQHHAWSALAHWIFERMSTFMQDAYERAHSITRTWEVSSRTASRYAAVLSGHFAFAGFCEEQGIDVSAQVERATDALRDCALAQARAAMSPAEVFRIRLRQMLTDGRVSFMGRPTVGPDLTEDQPFTDPRVIKQIENDDGGIVDQRIMPDSVNSLSDLGVTMLKTSAMPVTGSRVSGFVVPPRGGTGRQTSPFKNKWVVIIPTGDQRFANLCHSMTEYSKTRDGQTFRPDDVIRALTQENRGCRSRIRVQTNADPKVAKKISPTTVIEIDCSWLFSPIESES